MNSEKVRFGPAGNSDSFPHKSTLDAPEWLAGLGLDAYEYQCGHGVRISDNTAGQLGKAAKEHGVALSLHAPYYINLGGEGEEKLEKNYSYIAAAVRAAKAMGAFRVVVHPGSPAGRERTDAMKTASYSLKIILSRLEDKGLGDVIICPEVMGKLGQLGSLKEVLYLCGEDSRLLPCVDFGHLYARTHGGTDGIEALSEILDEIEKKLGFERAKLLHIHFSQIEYSKGGEVKHHNFGGSVFGPDYRPLMELLAGRGYCGTVICESRGTQAEDAKTMQNAYNLARGIL